MDAVPYLALDMLLILSYHSCHLIIPKLDLSGNDQYLFVTSKMYWYILITVGETSPTKPFVTLQSILKWWLSPLPISLLSPSPNQSKTRLFLISRVSSNLKITNSYHAIMYSPTYLLPICTFPPIDLLQFFYLPFYFLPFTNIKVKRLKHTRWKSADL